MRSITSLAAIALVGLVLTMVHTGPAYAEQVPMAAVHSVTMTDTVVTPDAKVSVLPVRYKYGYYGYWPGYRWYPGYSYGYYPNYYSGYLSYPSYYWYFPRKKYCYWYGGNKYCT